MNLKDFLAWASPSAGPVQAPEMNPQLQQVLQLMANKFRGLNYGLGAQNAAPQGGMYGLLSGMTGEGLMRDASGGLSNGLMGGMFGGNVPADFGGLGGYGPGESYGSMPDFSGGLGGLGGYGPGESY
jgi:hypothetical protein